MSTRRFVEMCTPNNNKGFKAVRVRRRRRTHFAPIVKLDIHSILSDQHPPAIHQDMYLSSLGDPHSLFEYALHLVQVTQVTSQDLRFPAG